MSLVTVKVLRAIDLLSKDEGLITADPYVKVLVGDKVAGRTNTVYKSLAPEWNEEVLNEYPVLAGDRELRFAIIDENRDRLEDKLGEVELPLVDVGLGRTLQVKLDIEACEGCEDATGELEVVVTWTEITDEATLQKIAEETAAIEAKKRKKEEKKRQAIEDARRQEESEGKVRSPGEDSYEADKLRLEKRERKEARAKARALWDEKMRSSGGLAGGVQRDEDLAAKAELQEAEDWPDETERLQRNKEEKKRERDRKRSRGTPSKSAAPKSSRELEEELEAGMYTTGDGDEGEDKPLVGKTNRKAKGRQKKSGRAAYGGSGDEEEGELADGCVGPEGANRCRSVSCVLLLVVLPLLWGLAVLVEYSTFGTARFEARASGASPGPANATWFYAQKLKARHLNQAGGAKAGGSKRALRADPLAAASASSSASSSAGVEAASDLVVGLEWATFDWPEPERPVARSTLGEWGRSPTPEPRMGAKSLARAAADRAASEASARPAVASKSWVLPVTGLVAGLVSNLAPIDPGLLLEPWLLSLKTTHSSAGTLAMVSAVQFWGNAVVGTLAWTARDARIPVFRAVSWVVPWAWSGYLVGTTRHLSLANVLLAAQQDQGTTHLDALGSPTKRGSDGGPSAGGGQRGAAESSSSSSSGGGGGGGAGDTTGQAPYMYPGSGGGSGDTGEGSGLAGGGSGSEGAPSEAVFVARAVPYATSLEVARLHTHLRLLLGAVVCLAASVCLIGLCIGGVHTACCPTSTGGAHAGCVSLPLWLLVGLCSFTSGYLFLATLGTGMAATTFLAVSVFLGVETKRAVPTAALAAGWCSLFPYLAHALVGSAFPLVRLLLVFPGLWLGGLAAPQLSRCGGGTCLLLVAVATLGAAGILVVSTATAQLQGSDGEDDSPVDAPLFGLGPLDALFEPGADGGQGAGGGGGWNATLAPTHAPTYPFPTFLPTLLATAAASFQPTHAPAPVPTLAPPPAPAPTAKEAADGLEPAPAPTAKDTLQPAPAPTAKDTLQPAPAPTAKDALESPPLLPGSPVGKAATVTPVPTPAPAPDPLAIKPTPAPPTPKPPTPAPPTPKSPAKPEPPSLVDLIAGAEKPKEDAGGPGDATPAPTQVPTWQGHPHPKMPPLMKCGKSCDPTPAPTEAPANAPAADEGTPSLAELLAMSNGKGKP